MKLNLKPLVILILLSVAAVTLLSVACEQVFAIGSPFNSKSTAISQWKSLCNAHPQYASYESIGKTVLGQDIWMFKIGNPDGGKVMYDGECHGPEDSGSEILYKFCKWLLESGDPTAQRILQRNYHLIVPVVNVDRSSVKTNAHGVDLNRNGVYGWGSSGSSNPSAPDYRGPSAGSEPETQALRRTWQKYSPKLYVNTHHGYSYVRYVSNTALEQSIVSLYGQKCSAMGVSDRYSFGSSSSGGFLSTDADMSFGISGWLWEVISWQDLLTIQKATQSSTVAVQMLVDKVYSKAFPLLLAIAEKTENAQSSSLPSPGPEPAPEPAPAPTSTTNAVVSSITWNPSRYVDVVENIKYTLLRDGNVVWTSSTIARIPTSGTAVSPAVKISVPNVAADTLKLTVTDVELTGHTISINDATTLGQVQVGGDKKTFTQTFTIPQQSTPAPAPTPAPTQTTITSITWNPSRYVDVVTNIKYTLLRDGNVVWTSSTIARIPTSGTAVSAPVRTTVPNIVASELRLTVTDVELTGHTIIINEGVTVGQVQVGGDQKTFTQTFTIPPP